METSSRFIAKGRKGNNFLDSTLEAYLQPCQTSVKARFPENTQNM